MLFPSSLWPAWSVLLLSSMVATAEAAAVSSSIVPLGHRIAERLPLLVGMLAHEAPVLRIDMDAATVRDCATADWSGVCDALPFERARRMARRCRRLLSVADAALERAGGPADGMRGLAATGLRQAISSEAMRLSALLRALSVAGCDGALPPEEPLTLTLLDGNRRVLVEPERGLDPTRRWSIRTTGPVSSALPAADVAAPLPDVLALSATRELASRLAERALDAPRSPALPAFVVDLPAPAATTPFWHAPVRLRIDPTGDIVPRDPRQAFPRPPVPERCPATAKPAPAIRDGLRRHDAIVEVRRGILESGVPFLLTVPRMPMRGVVVLVHSLDSDARTIVDLVADDLAGEGLASVAFDLPLHGERARSGERFLVADELAQFREHALAAVGDVVTLTAVVHHCTAALGLPSEVSTHGIGLLGYSIGGAIGLLAFGADPSLAAAVFIAPPGDIARWQGLLLARSLGLTDKICIGRDSNATCFDDATCGPGAVCELHPGLWLLGPAIIGPTRVLVGDAEPLGIATLLRPPADARAILMQYATEDWIVFPSQARQVGDALGLPPVPPGGDLPSRAMRAWPGGHDFILQLAVRAEAVRFLARHL